MICRGTKQLVVVLNLIIKAHYILIVAGEHVVLADFSSFRDCYELSIVEGLKVTELGLKRFSIVL